MSSKILAFETSTDVCSVAYQNEEGVFFEKRIRGRSVHSDHLFLFTRELMHTHNFKIDDLDTVLVSNGPGSYTGLRIAASALKGLLFGTKVNLIAVNTLAGFAQSVIDERPEKIIHAIIDARRVHVYHQAFKADDLLVPLSDPGIKKLEDFENTVKPGHVIIGTGMERLSEKALTDISAFGPEHISAINLIKLFNRQPDAVFFTKTDTEDLDPEYLTSNQVNNSQS